MTNIFWILFLYVYFHVGQPFQLGIPGALGHASSLSGIPFWSVSGHMHPLFSTVPSSFGHLSR
ncbi:hypothetical protein [Chryseobacterium rhizosphaerae]|uniref:hypothetical protein n=1 Tax=Chryseobacterium rhizosphaerae TaxID=395937 RepID=UPI003D0C2119